MYKKNIKIIIYIIFYFFSFYKTTQAKDFNAEDIQNYFQKLNEFSCNFIQANPDGSVSEGKMIYSNDKIKINYIKPSKITFIAKKNKAMYYNEDLEELHYFNPNKTAFSIFKSFFKFSEMPKEIYNLINNNNVIKINLTKVEVEEITKFEVIFQNSPLELKKIQWTTVDGYSIFSIYNLDTQVMINKKTFSMASPILNN